jgi:hypothetical protein
MSIQSQYWMLPRLLTPEDVWAAKCLIQSNARPYNPNSDCLDQFHLFLPIPLSTSNIHK